MRPLHVFINKKICCLQTFITSAQTTNFDQIQKYWFNWPNLRVQGQLFAPVIIWKNNPYFGQNPRNQF